MIVDAFRSVTLMMWTASSVQVSEIKIVFLAETAIIGWIIAAVTEGKRILQCVKKLCINCNNTKYCNSKQKNTTII